MTFLALLEKKPEWYPLQRLNLVPRGLLEIQTTPPHWHLALILAHELILVVTTPGVAQTFKTVINEMTHGTDFKLVNLLHAKNANFTHQDLNASIDKPKNRWNMYLVSYDTSTSRAKPSSNSRLSYFSWSFGISDESHQYKTKNSVGWRIATTVRIGFQLQVTATPQFDSLYDWCYQAIWLCAGAPEDQEADTVMEMHGADSLYSTVKSLMHDIRTADQDTQQDVAHRMIQIAKPWTIRRSSESTLGNGYLRVRIPKGNVHLVDLEWTDDKEATLKTLVERYTLRGASGV